MIQLTNSTSKDTDPGHITDYHEYTRMWAASKTWLQRCSNPKVLSPRFRAQGFHFRDPLLLSPAFAANFAVFRRKVLLSIMVVTKTYTCSLSRRLSRLFILKALSRSFRQAFARGVLAYAQHKNINVDLKPLHKGFWCCSCGSWEEETAQFFVAQYQFRSVQNPCDIPVHWLANKDS